MWTDKSQTSQRSMAVGKNEEITLLIRDFSTLLRTKFAFLIVHTLVLRPEKKLRRKYLKNCFRVLVFWKVSLLTRSIRFLWLKNKDWKLNIFVVLVLLWRNHLKELFSSLLNSKLMGFVFRKVWLLTRSILFLWFKSKDWKLNTFVGLFFQIQIWTKKF